MIDEKIKIRHYGVIGDYQIYHGISSDNPTDMFYPEYIFYVRSNVVDMVQNRTLDAESINYLHNLIPVSDFVIQNNTLVKSREWAIDLIEHWIKNSNVGQSIPSLGDTIKRFSGIPEISGKVNRSSD